MGERTPTKQGTSLAAAVRAYLRHPSTNNRNAMAAALDEYETGVLKRASERSGR